MLVDEIHKIQEESLENSQSKDAVEYQKHKNTVIEYIKEYAKDNPTKEFMEIHRDGCCIICFDRYSDSLPTNELCRRIIQDNFIILAKDFQKEGVTLEKIEVYELRVVDKFFKTKPIEEKVDEYYKISWR